MGRKKEIHQAANSYSPRNIIYSECFANGARWADKTMLDKICEWISHNYNNYHTIECMLQDLRKVAEE